MIDDAIPTAIKGNTETLLSVPDTQVSPVESDPVLLGNSETRVDLQIISPADARAGNVHFGFSDTDQDIADYQDHADSPYALVGGVAANEILSNITASSRYMAVWWDGADVGSLTVTMNITQKRR